MRVYFEDNPWPNGHGIKNSEWYGLLDKEGFWFHLHVETQSYNLEDSEDCITEDECSVWKSKKVWNEYGNCIISTNHWDEKGILLGTEEEKFCFKDFDNVLLKVDTVSCNPTIEELDKLLVMNAFDIHLLGYDSTLNHTIKFERIKEDDYNILWTGNIVLTNLRDFSSVYSFKMNLDNIKFGDIEVRDAENEEEALILLRKYIKDVNGFIYEEDADGKIKRFKIRK